MHAIQPGRSPFQEQAVLSNNQRLLLGLVGVGSMLEFWDAYLIGFIMAFLVKPWGLTYGVMAAVLLASGAGAIVGGVVWGALSDRFGRKPVFVASLLLLAASSVALAFTPEGGWLYMAALRTVVGFCTAAYFIQIALVNEFMPPRRRAMLTGVVSSITTCGLLLGALSGAFIIPAIGWRWTFALGAAPAIVALVGACAICESPRWLSLRGRHEEARRAVAWAMGQPAGTAETVPAAARADAADAGDPASRPAARPEPAKWRDIFAYPRSVVTATLVNLGLIAGYYGIVLWAPTLLSQVQSLTPADASKLMIAFSVLGVLSRLAAAALADRIGRRRTGGCFALAAAAFIVLAGYVGHGDLLTPSLFWLPLLLAFVLADGSFAVCAVYSTEIWPARVRGSGAGYAGLAGSVGKIVGPLGLAAVAGSSHMVMPSATLSVIVPAFGFLAACLAVCGVTYLFVGIEAKGKPLEAIDQELDARAAAGSPAAGIRHQPKA